MNRQARVHLRKGTDPVGRVFVDRRWEISNGGATFTSRRKTRAMVIRCVSGSWRWNVVADPPGGGYLFGIEPTRMYAMKEAEDALRYLRR